MNQVLFDARIVMELKDAFLYHYSINNVINIMQIKGLTMRGCSCLQLQLFNVR